MEVVEVVEVHRYFRICFKSMSTATKTSAHTITESMSAVSMSAGLHMPNGLLSAADMAITGNIKMLATIGDTCKPINIPINGATRPNTPPHTNAFLLLFNIPKLYHRVLAVRFLCPLPVDKQSLRCLKVSNFVGQ